MGAALKHTTAVPTTTTTNTPANTATCQTGVLSQRVNALPLRELQSGGLYVSSQWHSCVKLPFVPSVNTHEPWEPQSMNWEAGSDKRERDRERRHTKVISVSTRQACEQIASGRKVWLA